MDPFSVLLGEKQKMSAHNSNPSAPSAPSALSAAPAFESSNILTGMFSGRMKQGPPSAAQTSPPFSNAFSGFFSRGKTNQELPVAAGRQSSGGQEKPEALPAVQSTTQSALSSPVTRAAGGCDVRSLGSDNESDCALSRGNRKRLSMPLDEDGNAYVPMQRPIVVHEEEKRIPSSASTAQPEKARTPYAEFMEKIREPAAKPLVDQITAFLNSFANIAKDTRKPELLHDFLSRTHTELGHLYDDYFEGLEKLVVNGLYPLVFAKDLQDQAEDRRLRRLISALAWVDFVHLEIPPKDPRLLDLAVSELRRMDEYKSPRDKLICVLNACRVIGNVLQNAQNEQEEATTAGADDFLPLLIYCLIRANPPNLKSNLEYVENYRHPSLMHGEEAYFFMTLLSAMTFVSQITWESLNIAEEEYERLYEAHLPDEKEEEKEQGEDVEEVEENEPSVGNVEDSCTEMTPIPPPPKTDVQKALAEMNAQKVIQLFSSVTFKYEAATSPFNLRLREVEELLEEYHRMSRFLQRMQFHLDRVK